MTTIYKRVIGLDVNHAQISGCAIIEDEHGERRTANRTPPAQYIQARPVRARREGHRPWDGVGAVASSRTALNKVLTIACFDALGMPLASHNLNYSNRPVRTRMPGVAGYWSKIRATVS